MFSFTCSIVSDKPSAARRLSSLTAFCESDLLPVRLSTRSVFPSRFLKQAGRFLEKDLGQIYIYIVHAQ